MLRNEPCPLIHAAHPYCAQEAVTGRRQGGSPMQGGAHHSFHSTAWGGGIGDVDPEEEVRPLRCTKWES